MIFLLFIFIVLCSMGDVVLKNVFARGDVCTDGDNHVYNAIACLIGAPLALLIHGVSPVSLPTILFAFGYGFCMAFVAIYGVKSLKTGPMSLTGIFGSFSMIIPILFGFLFWHEDISALKLLGIAAMFVAVYLITSPSVDCEITKTWIINVIIYALSTGFMTTFQQIAAKAKPDENSLFLIIGYITATAVICVELPFLNRKVETRVSKKFFSKENLNGLLVGSIGALNAISVMKILTLMDSTVFYPLKVGVCLIGSALLGYLFFHERLGKKQLAGFVTGTAAVLILTVF